MQEMSEDKRESMVIYRSFYDSIRLLSVEDQAAIWDAVFNRGFYNKKPNLQGMAFAVWLLIEPQIEANLRKYLNGKRPKTKQTRSKTEANTKQSGSKHEGNVNDNVNVNVNDNDIKERTPKYSKFYDNEILLAANPEYEMFIEFLYGENETGEPLKNVLKLPKQFSYKKWQNLKSEYFDRGVKVTPIILAMENYNKLQNNTDAYLTCRNWIERDLKAA
jgi:hypothetical protein